MFSAERHTTIVIKFLRVYDFLQEIGSGKLQLIEGDITRVDLRQIFGKDPKKRSSQKVVANLPFNITTDVLKLLLPLGDVISEIFVMLQVIYLQELCNP